MEKTMVSLLVFVKYLYKFDYITQKYRFNKLLKVITYLLNAVKIKCTQMLNKLYSNPFCQLVIFCWETCTEFRVLHDRSYLSRLFIIL